MPKASPGKVTGLARHYDVVGVVSNAPPLVAYDQKLIKPAGIRAAWRWSREEERWVLVRVRVTGQRLRPDDRGTIPGERSTAWGEKNIADAPGWVREFLETRGPSGKPN